MSLPDYERIQTGTPVSATITLAGLTNNSARQGVKMDLGAIRSTLWRAALRIALNSAANGAVELFLGFSDNATPGDDNPAGLTGTDTTLSTPNEATRPLVFVGALQTISQAGSNPQWQYFWFAPMARYVCPVVVNRAGVAFHAAASNFLLELAPMHVSIEDN